MIKRIDVADLPIYVNLVLELKGCTVATIKEFACNVDKDMHFGLYVDNATGPELVGFITATAISTEIVYFKDIYVREHYRLKTKEFVTQTEKAIKELGYKYWISTAITKNGKSLLKKLGEALNG